MGSMIRTLRVAGRRLYRKPTFSLLTLLTIALGIGTTTLLYTVVDTVLLRPLPFGHAAEVARVYGTVAETGEDEAGLSLPDYHDFRDASSAFEEIAAFVRWNFNVAGDDVPQRVWGAQVTYNLMRALGVRPIRGRDLTPEDDVPGADPVVVLGYGAWQRLYAGAEDVLGKMVRLDDVEHEIVGVMPSGFEYPRDAELWKPLAMARDQFPRQLHFLRGVGSVAPDSTIQQAQAEMEEIAGRLAKEYPASNEGRGIRLVPVREEIVGAVRPALLVLLGAAVLVLLIACANVMILFSVRAVQRQAEVAVQRALGASRWSLLRPFLAEGSILAALGAAGGLALAWLGTTAVTKMAPYDLPRLDSITVDARIAAVAVALAVTTALVASLAPMLHLARQNPTEALRDAASRAGQGSGGRRLHRALIIAEVAIALTLAIGAGLLMRSLQSLQRIDAGLGAPNVLTAQLTLPWSTYARPHQTDLFYRQLLDRLHSAPGVEAASAVWRLPLVDLRGNAEIEVVGRPMVGGSAANMASVQVVAPAYFETIGVPLTEGRDVDDRDDADHPPVVMVNRAFADRFFPDGEAVGSSIRFAVNFGPVGGIAEAPREIVGIVADFKNVSLAEAVRPELYVPYRQAAWRMMSLVVATSVPPSSVADSVREAVWSIDPYQPVSEIQTLGEVVSSSTAQERFNTILLGLFALIAMAMAMVGIFGVISFWVGRQTREIGMRRALGARNGDIFGKVLREGLTLTAIGLGLGLVGALALRQVLAGLLYGIEATDLTTWTAVTLGTLVVSLLALVFPARRAVTIDPLVAMRE